MAKAFLINAHVIAGRLVFKMFTAHLNIISQTPIMAAHLHKFYAILTRNCIKFMRFLIKTA